MDPARRYTPDEYRGLIATGELPEGPGYELIGGRVVKVPPPSPPRAATIGRVWKRFQVTMPVDWVIHTRYPVTLGDSEPEPDVTVVRDQPYLTRHPGPADIVLVVEVADSSRLIDRRDKQRIYGKAGLPEYWVVNIPDRQVEVYTGPQPAADPPVYATVTVYRDGQSVPLPTGGAVAVADLLP